MLFVPLSRCPYESDVAVIHLDPVESLILISMTVWELCHKSFPPVIQPQVTSSEVFVMISQMSTVCPDGQNHSPGPKPKFKILSQTFCRLLQMLRSGLPVCNSREGDQSEAENIGFKLWFCLGPNILSSGGRTTTTVWDYKNTPCWITSGNLMICFILQVLKQSFFYNLNNAEL